MAESPAVYEGIYRRFAAGELTIEGAARAIMAATESGAGPFSLAFEGSGEAKQQRGQELFKALQLLAIENGADCGAP